MLNHPHLAIFFKNLFSLFFILNDTPHNLIGIGMTCNGFYLCEYFAGLILERVTNHLLKPQTTGPNKRRRASYISEIHLDESMTFLCRMLMQSLAIWQTLPLPLLHVFLRN